MAPSHLEDADEDLVVIVDEDVVSILHSVVHIEVLSVAVVLLAALDVVEYYV